MQVDGVLHEFSSIPGVREDVTDVVLNVKAIALRMGGEGPKRMRLRAEGPGEVTASQIETGHDIEIMNPSLVRSEEHTSELQSLMRISYAVFCLNKKRNM